MLNVGSGVVTALFVALVATEATKRYGVFDPNREVDTHGLSLFLAGIAFVVCPAS